MCGGCARGRVLLFLLVVYGDLVIAGEVMGAGG